MRDQQNQRGHLIRNLAHQGQHLGPQRRAKCGKGFIKEEERPCPQQRPGEGGTACLAPRQL